MIIRRNLVALVFLLVPLHTVLSQQFDWDRLHVGLGVDLLLPQNDFGAFWNNAPAFGAAIRYDLDEKLFVLSSASAASFKTKPGINKGEIPDFLYVTLAAFVSRKVVANESLSIEMGIGIGNHTFAFRGPAARLYDQNVTESESSLAAALSFSFSPPIVALISVTSTYHHIFSFPERIGVWSVGAMFYFR